MHLRSLGLMTHPFHFCVVFLSLFFVLVEFHNHLSQKTKKYQGPRGHEHIINTTNKATLMERNWILQPLVTVKI